jgi:hypothetical protein
MELYCTISCIIDTIQQTFSEWFLTTDDMAALFNVPIMHWSYCLFIWIEIGDTFYWRKLTFKKQPMGRYGRDSVTQRAEWNYTQKALMRVV